MDSTTPSSDPFHGLNPADLMAAAAMPTDGGADTLPLSPRDLPSLAEIAAAFPDLEIQDLIGHGGMSAVFRARQPKLDRVVALKVLPKSLAATPGFAERFTREGRVLARLSHPSIVTVHDFGESGGFCFLIMEYVDGVNLRQAMRAGRFTPEQALNIIPAMCEALQYAHSQGVLHRDIKPENVLLDTKGKVKIADFGIAKILDEKGDGGMMLTQSGAKLGTAPYMAPEQIEKPGSVDHRADIYSLGVVFYEMLTGELPLGRFAAPSEKSTVNGNMDEVVFRALAKDRALRQQSAGEFKTQIEGIASMPVPLQRALANRFQSFEYRSKRTLFGRPLVHVTSGIDPATGRKRVARGIFAVGDKAVGVFAFGGYARGWFAFGGVAVGGVTFGGLSVGLISMGGLALALLLAVGGLSVGLLASGGMAVGWEAVGGVAAGVHAYGGRVFALVAGMGGQVNAPEEMNTLMHMPPLLVWLVWLSNMTVVMSLIWIPLTLPSVLVPWWARKQIEFEAQGGTRGTTAWHQRPARVFWLLPLSLLFCYVVACVFFFWVNANGAMIEPFILATVVEGIGLLLLALSMPLWLRLVPMNSFYGVRLPSTFASDERWYEVNAVFGKHLFWWSLAVIASGIAGFYQLQRHQDAYAWAAITLTLVGVAAAVVSTLVWMRRHPVGRAAIKPHRLVRNLELVIPVVVLILFVRSFIARPYIIPHGNEPGVAKNSRWIASHLNTGFVPGDLIAYAHESGQTWIARVVAVQPKGLLLKRASSPEEFFMPWDKIIGKMLFSYLSPGSAMKAPVSAASASPPSVVEGTAHALGRQPVLRFMRVKRSRQEWQAPLYSPEGAQVNDEALKRLVMTTAGGNMYGQGADDCWLQLWFEHSDFDAHSSFGVEIAGTDGLPLKDRDTSVAGPPRTLGEPSSPWLSFSISPGRIGKLPSEVQITLRYSIGPWQPAAVLPADYNGSMSISGDCMLAGFGDDPEHRAFVSWSMSSEETFYDVVARLKNGKSIGSFGSSRTSQVRNMVQSVKFLVPLREVESFQFRSRQMRSVTFPHVVIPPLP